MGAGTTALTSVVEKRGDTLNYHPVWERVITFTFANGTASATTHNLNINGILQKLIVVAGASGSANPTATVAVNDNADTELFSVAGLVENSTTVYSLSEPLTGVIDIVVTPSTDPLAAYTVIVYLRGI